MLNLFYKFKRQVSNQIKSSKKTFKKNVRHKNDFSWRKKQSNPYKLKDTKTPKKRKIFAFIFFVISMVTVGLWLFHPFFYITKISVSGNDRIDSSDILLTAKSYISQKKMYVIPGDTFLVVDQNKIEDILLSKYPLKEVMITKSFPSELSIVVQEKISYLIVDDTKTYAIYDLEGNNVETLKNVGKNEWKIEYEDVVVTSTSSTINMTNTTSTEIVLDQNSTSTTPIITQKREVARVHTPDFISIKSKYAKYPLVVFPDHDQKLIQNEIKTYGKKIIFLFEEFPNIVNGGVDYIVFNDQRNLQVISDNKLSFIFTFISDISKQLNLIKQVIEQNEKPTTYIDVRFGDRAFWK